jgi:hypothetical protein
VAPSAKVLKRRSGSVDDFKISQIFIVLRMVVSGSVISGGKVEPAVVSL